MILCAETKVRIDPRKNEVEPSQSVPEEHPLDSLIPDELHFVKNSPKTVMAAVGSPAHIPCNVRNSGSKSVSKVCFLVQVPPNTLKISTRKHVMDACGYPTIYINLILFKIQGSWAGVRVWCYAQKLVKNIGGDWF